MKRVLFVDDEPRVLDGLRDMLRKQRRVWDMVFARGAEAALEELARAPFDVVVSDMRMPGMDGATFLGRVKELSPATARIVLSGHAEEAMILKALPVCHQYLSKPCSTEALRGVIERACELQTLLVDPRLRALAGSVGTLPSVPAIYWELTQALADPEVGAADVSKIVERDLALSAKVLQIVNSSFFGLPQRTTSVGKAVSYLGLSVVKAVAVTLQVFSAGASARPIPGFSVEELQQRAVLVAEIARRIIRDPKRAEEAYLAGLLHDMGKIILALGAPERFAEALRLAADSGHPLHLVEKEILHVSHAEVGAFLLGSWGLPLPIVAAVAYHHKPAAAASDDVDLTVAVHVASALVDGADQAGAARSADQLDTATLEALGMAQELVRWRGVAAAVLRKGTEAR